MQLKFKLLLLFFLVAFDAHSQVEGTKMSSKEMRILVDSLSAALKRWYIYPDKAKLISKTIKDKYKAGAYDKLKNRREVAEAIHSDMQKAHHDGHMRLMYFPDLEKQLLTVLPDSVQKQEEQKQFKEEQARNFYFIKTEILSGNIGYVRWDCFVGWTKEALPTYDAAFRFVSNSKAVIIDMRNNFGGSPETVNAMLNYFFDKRLPMNHIIDHAGDTVKYYSNPTITAFKLSMPVYVLTSKNTFSGGEDFTYALKYANRATIVGDTTRGGAHPTGPAPLGQGFVLNIPNARSYHEVTHGDWEGTGVFPDVYVKAPQALDKTQSLIFKSLLDKSNDEEEKRQLQCQLTAFENKLNLAQHGAKDFTQQQLEKFCGVYKPVPGPGASPNDRTILLKGNDLYGSIPFPPDWKLIPISDTRFLYDNDEVNRYMEFKLDQNGNPTGLTIYYTDGKTYSFERMK